MEDGKVCEFGRSAGGSSGLLIPNTCFFTPSRRRTVAPNQCLHQHVKETPVDRSASGGPGSNGVMQRRSSSARSLIPLGAPHTSSRRAERVPVLVFVWRRRRRARAGVQSWRPTVCLDQVPTTHTGGRSNGAPARGTLGPSLAPEQRPPSTCTHPRHNMVQSGGRAPRRHGAAPQLAPNRSDTNLNGRGMARTTGYVPSTLQLKTGAIGASHSLIGVKPRPPQNRSTNPGTPCPVRQACPATAALLPTWLPAS